ncbi:hypothetical protein Lal_00021092 [Lupinus albus]|uniref:DUF8039 domain-containing protein n=1 Tax=Lupinus albus TaxID=3870 RepID=A0A6A5PCG1_LUPAL|nr:hypothetical protein Lalb_Chr15g0082651 [Lupinus albus]KAF1894798.1 hypothetical protein Lal_00021092 [Lupinus albus]
MERKMEAGKFVKGREASTTVKESFTHTRNFILIPNWELARCTTQDAMIHNAQIPSNHLKVSFDISIEDDVSLPILVDDDTITVRGALGTFVAWPVHLIDVVPIMGKVFADHSAISPPRIDEHSSKKAKVVKSKPWSKSNLESSGEVVPKKTNFCEKLMNQVHKLPVDSTIVLSIPLPIYEFSADEFITINDVKDVHNHDWIGASVIFVCIRYLYDNFIPKSKKKVMFLSPHSNTLLSNDIRKKDQAEYVAGILDKNKDNADLFLAPLNIG